jgi:hypothetical protein
MKTKKNNYWIIAGSPFWSAEMRRSIISIQLLEDEQTYRQFRSSELIIKHQLQNGYLTPGNFIELRSSTSERYADIDELEVFDLNGVHISTINIRGKFGLFASWDCMKGNGWI